MKMRFKVLIAGIIVCLITATGGTAALAYTDNLGFNQKGGVVVNSVNSNMSIKVSSTTYKIYIPIGGTSRNYYETQDVDAFWVPAWAVAVNVNTGYGYDGGSTGRWFYLANDSVYIALDIYYY